MELAAASTVATFCLPSTGFARVVASKTMSSANRSAKALCDWSAKPQRLSGKGFQRHRVRIGDRSGTRAESG